MSINKLNKRWTLKINLKLKMNLKYTSQKKNLEIKIIITKSRRNLAGESGESLERENNRVPRCST